MRAVDDFFFNDRATTEIYTLSLHDARPIYDRPNCRHEADGGTPCRCSGQPRDLGSRASGDRRLGGALARSEEHTAELQSRQYLVCRLLLEKTEKRTSA